MPSPSTAEELKKLHDLKEIGALSDEEIAAGIARLCADLELSFLPYGPVRRPSANFSEVFVCFLGVLQRLDNLKRTLFNGVCVDLQKSNREHTGSRIGKGKMK